MQKRKIAFLAAGTLLFASVALAEELFVNADTVDIRSGAGGLFPIVGHATKGASLTAIKHEGKWINVNSGTVTGYVYEDSMSASAPGFDPLATFNIKPSVTEGSATKGLTPTATTYARGKNLDPKALDDLIAFRAKIDPKEWVAFCAVGKIGPDKPAAAPAATPTATMPTTLP